MYRKRYRKPLLLDVRQVMVFMSRPSFTLVELLVAIAIMGMLAGMVMVAMAGAQRDAQVARTRSTIQKINRILLSKYRELTLSPVPIDIPSDLLRPGLSSSNQPYYPISGRELARTRLIAMRHLLRFEIPDRLTDWGFEPVRYPTGEVPLYLESRLPNGANRVPNASVTLRVPIQNQIIFQSLKPFKIDSNGNQIPWYQYDPVTLSFPDAKLLYQIIATTTSEENSGIEAFHPSEIGDPDEDGNPEFIDAWGTPIRFVRWPAGAWRWSPVARVGRDAELYSWYFNGGTTWLDSGTSGGDRIDTIRADWRYLDDSRTMGIGSVDPGINDTKLNNPYDLAPLVVSAGPDRQFGLIFSGEDIGGTGPDYGNMLKPTGSSIPSSGHDNRYRYPDPYFEFSTVNTFTTNELPWPSRSNAVSQPAQIGDPISQAYVDNVSSFDTVD